MKTIAIVIAVSTCVATISAQVPLTQPEVPLLVTAAEAFERISTLEGGNQFRVLLK